LSGGVGVVRERWRDSQPEAAEQGQCFGRDADIAFNPLDLPRQPVETAGENGLVAVRPIRRQKRRDRRLDNRRTRVTFAGGEIRAFLQQLRREEKRDAASEQKRDHQKRRRNWPLASSFHHNLRRRHAAMRL
jgi:hypothetical protein